MPLTTAIGTYLQTQGEGTLGTNIFYGTLPDEPDACFAIFDYAGMPVEKCWAGEYPGFQIRTRGALEDYTTPFNKAYSIMKKLHGLVNQTLSGCMYHYIYALGSPIFMGKDKNGRMEFVVNFIAIKERE